MKTILNKSWWPFSVSRGKDIRSLGSELMRKACLLRLRYLRYPPTDFREDCAITINLNMAGKNQYSTL